MKRLLLLVTVLLLVLGCFAILGAFYLFINQPVALGQPRPAVPGQPVLGTDTPTEPIPTVAATSTPPVTNPTLSELTGLDVPSDDPIQIAARLKGETGIIATPVAPRIYRAGDQAQFWVARDITGTYQIVTATLKYVTPHSYMWLENGLNVDDNALKAASDTFENKIYPTDRKYFGSEPTPGIDNDPHLFILNTEFHGALGYYSSEDEYPTFIKRYSNQHELFYMNVQSLPPGSSSYASVLAHEFTHMIHWNQNKREGSWITEGFGDLGMQLNGYPQATNMFVLNPNLQLNAWASAGGQQLPHYEAAYLFLSYLLNRFGDSMIRDIFDSGAHDIASVQKALNQVSPGLVFDDVFADWTVANFINDQSMAPRYGYADRSVGITPQHQLSQYPASGEDTVSQYGTQYISLKPAAGNVTFTFDGSTQVKVIPTDAHSGRSMWWSNRVDQSDTTLTREFDLTSVKKATLRFWTWYDIEADFDYGYVEVSTDGGKRWHTLPGSSTTDRDPNGANYGNGLTCKSGSGCDQAAPPAQWIQEQMDLSPYAGQKVQLRFEYITDAIYAGPGFAVDDISIPEINYSDDVEHGDAGWQAQGFARIDNILPQRFILQAIEYDPSGNPSKIVPVALDKSNHGSVTFTGFGGAISRVVMVVSGDTPDTWETATYKYTIH